MLELVSNTGKRELFAYESSAREMEFFKLKIMAIHEKKYALVG